LEVVNRLFLLKDTTTPLLGALAGMVINVVLAVLYRVLMRGGSVQRERSPSGLDPLIIAHWLWRYRNQPVINTLARTLLAAGAMVR
jgi:hypothetical protein